MYLTNNSVHFAHCWPVILGIVGGGVVGAKMLNKLNNRTIKGIFIFFMFVGGVAMLFR